MMGNTNTQRGFTIVELLIVIVVIAILAAITIVAYNGIQGRSNDASIQSDLANLSKQFGMFYADNGVYPSTATDLAALDVRINKNSYWIDAGSPFNLVPCIASSAQEYSISAISPSGKRFYITNGGGVREYTGATAWTGTVNYGPMCTTTLSGSSVISGGAGYGNGWRTWANG